MIAPFELRVAITISCAFCDKGAIVLDGALRAGDSMPKPSLPDHWRMIDGKPLCPNHVVSIQNIEHPNAARVTRLRD